MSELKTSDLTAFEKQHGLGFLRNCYVKSRDNYKTGDTPLFYDKGDQGVRCYLDGYHIIPSPEYEKLTEENKQLRDMLCLSKVQKKLWRVSNDL